MGNRTATTDQVVPELLDRLRGQHAGVQIWFGHYSGQFLAITKQGLIAASSARELGNKINAASSSRSGQVQA